MEYLHKISEKLLEIESSEKNSFLKISQIIAEKIQAGGIIHVFGCGHSSLLAQDAFYRAGGLVPVQPVLIEALMLHQGALDSSNNERISGFVEPYLQEENLQQDDVMIVISTSGRNPAPVEAAEFSRKEGGYTVGLTSLAYAESQPSRCPSGLRLEQVVDDVLDLKVPVGDASLESPGLNQKFAPMSSVLGAAVLHELLSQIIIHLHESGKGVPIFQSGNVNGSDKHNKIMVNKYPRIPF